MTQQRLQRFDFNSLRDFRGPIVMKTVAKDVPVFVEPAPPPPPTFSQADLDAACLFARREGYLEGFTAGGLEAQKNFEAKADEVNTMLLGLTEQVRALDEQYRMLLAEESEHLSALVRAIAAKVAGDALDARGELAISQLVERCLPVVFSKPRLQVELHPDMLAPAMERIEATLLGHGFEGEIHFKANESLAPSDVSLDWGNGQVYRSTEQLWSEIDALLTQIPLEITFAQTLDTTTTPTGE